MTSPFNYPTNNLKDITTFRSMEDPPPWPEELSGGSLFSSVQFLECPINAKQRHEVELEILSEVEIEWVVEVRLAEDCRAEWVETRFLRYENVSDLEVFLDGNSLNYYCSEYEGKKYYTIPGFNLTQKGEVKKFEIRFKIERFAFPTPFVRTPLLFNENYAVFINFPLAVIPVQVGNMSDANMFKIKLDLPFRKISMKQSGWMDAFVPPRSEWILVNPDYNTYEYMMFEYPIEQECRNEGNTYFFTTYFSEDNIANLIKVILVPDWRIPGLLLVFLGSPFYIPFFVWVRKKTEKKPNDQEFRSKDGVAWKILGMLRILLKLYIGPLAFVAGLIIGGAMNPEMLFYMMKITRWGVLGLVLTFIYPVICSLFFYKWKGKI